MKRATSSKQTTRSSDLVQTEKNLDFNFRRLKHGKRELNFENGKKLNLRSLIRTYLIKTTIIPTNNLI